MSLLKILNAFMRYIAWGSIDWGATIMAVWSKTLSQPKREISFLFSSFSFFIENAKCLFLPAREKKSFGKISNEEMHLIRKRAGFPRRPLMQASREENEFMNKSFCETQA